MRREVIHTSFKKENQRIADKIKNKEDLTEKELSRLLSFEIDRIEGEEHRWSRSMKSIILLNNKQYMLEWDKSLTECHQDDFCYQPYEVEKKEYDKTIHVVEWVRVVN